MHIGSLPIPPAPEDIIAQKHQIISSYKTNHGLFGLK